MKAGRIARLEDARRYLDEEHGVEYAGVSSISALFKRRGVKLKTGRRQHRRADEAQQLTFKNEFAAEVKARSRARFGSSP